MLIYYARSAESLVVAENGGVPKVGIYDITVWCTLLGFCNNCVSRVKSGLLGILIFCIQVSEIDFKIIPLGFVYVPASRAEC